MELVSSESAEVVRAVAPAGALARWRLSLLGFACLASAPGLLIALVVGFFVSARAAAWVGAPVVLVSNVYVLRRALSLRLNWITAVSSGRVYIRLFMRSGGASDSVSGPDAAVLEASEIASMSAREVEVFLYGPKPRTVQWLAVELSRGVAEEVTGRIGRALQGAGPGERALVSVEGGRLSVEWKRCRPALSRFLQQVARQCPSFGVGKDERSELDLNRIWVGISMDLSARQRQALAQAVRLGFYCECRGLLCRYKYISIRKAAAYLAEIEQEGGEPEHAVGQN